MSDIGPPLVTVYPSRDPADDDVGWPDEAPLSRWRWNGSLPVNGYRLALIGLVLVLWQVMSGPVLPTYAVSKPTAVAHSLRELLTSSAGWESIKTTSFELGVGFLLGVAIGAVGALILGTFTTLGRVLDPLIAAANGIPKIALAPVFLLFFGIGAWSKIAIAVTSVAFVMFYNLYLGLRLVRSDLVETVRVMGGRRRAVLTFVTIPSLVSPFIAGMKAGGPLAIVGVVAGEFVASFDGIGHLLFEDSNNLDAAGVFATLIILVVMALIINSVLNLLDRLVARLLGAPAAAGGNR